MLFNIKEAMERGPETGPAGYTKSIKHEDLPACYAV
jgi:hypothetical protein